MANKTTRTPVKDAKFFELIAGGATISDACRAVGYTRTVVYTYKSSDAKFSEAWDEANETAIERMEREADRRAVEGYDKPVFHLGVECGVQRQFSDTLLIFRLKAKRPEVYRERAEVAVTVTDEIASRIKAARTREKK